jgi:Uma2 family endonuclease
LGHFVFILADECNLQLALGGSMTFRREDLERGLEPDNCFWIANAARVRGRVELDFTVDPPPDLALEVEISPSALDRMEIYAAMRIPEVWRSNGETVDVGILQSDQTYRWGKGSLAFPMFPVDELGQFLRLAQQQDHLEVIRAFRGWFRSRLSGQ